MSTRKVKVPPVIGNHTGHPCPNRSDAVAAGCKLPITSQELDKLDVTHHQGTMTEYLKTKAFDLKVFNQLLVMWLAKVVTTRQDLGSKKTQIQLAESEEGGLHHPEDHLSAAKRFEYTTWSENLEINGPSLIAGYGVRWNIKFQSRERGYKGQMVIAKLLELEKHRQKHEGGPNYFSNLDITLSEWEVVNQLNETLSEFYFLTKKMEGDYSSGCLIISEYQCMKAFINNKLTTAKDPDLQAMLRKMLTKTTTYLDKALTCDAWFPSYYTYTEEPLRSVFNSKKAEIEATKEPAPAPEKQKKDKSGRTVNHEFDFFPETVEAPVADELSIYLGGIYKLHSDHVKESLEWWKEHCQEFPILALLARDYLACCATSALVERCFSAAADTCSSDRGSLAARTIERCVSSHQWLAQGIKPDAEFETAQQIVTLANQEREREKAEKAAIETAKE
ncbi:hypothetical protein PSHT_11081 [Puccinia striiformis]|uniref:HAT C-terminal dimerisation domain-containing protein n=1 Tax=Puccinia striiformis TaxID=27350 RepID=A0A2S4V5M0_9BASI|nr:hypothetical protein PSHT_11081 [Puccinia striiformis]